ncbi:MAG: ATP-dependent DNA helicase RecG [Bacteroidota bacterium]|nr:ATP-dependent DNA helicase RecG [Bacteroidota bacterium]
MGLFEEGIQFLKGVGPYRAAAFNESGVANCHDLLHFFPRRYLDNSSITRVSQLNGEPATIVGTVIAAGEVLGGRRSRYEVTVRDDGMGRINMIWFHGYGWVKNRFSPRDRVAFHGRPNRFNGQWSMVHPEFDKLDEVGPQLSTGRIIALYPGGIKLDRAGLTSRTVRRIIYELIKARGWDIPQVLPAWIQTEYDLMEGHVALRAIHFPKNQSELHRARTRLKFEELFFLQLLLKHIQKKRKLRLGVKLTVEGAKLKQFIMEVLPFTLTEGQRAALRDIKKDVQEGRQMHRLIQGDVGSGKTVVAVAALLMAVDDGFQGAFMVPTEVLAEQQYKSLVNYLEPLGVNVRLLVGSQRTKERRDILSGLSQGTVDIVVGTHALFQESVKFKQLVLAVIDEQHRFGVRQRGELLAKGNNPHALLMTATPIPRSLALTRYGDLDISLIKDLPGGRRPIRTRLRSEKRRGEMHDLVSKELARGHQVYVVFPQVEESEMTDLKDAQRGFEEWKKRCPNYRTALVHGQMPADEKERAMNDFKANLVQVLVATTVIEVGVDTPNATVMVIEHAERFGLSQLHQMRGRVGRGTAQSYCILMASYAKSAEAKVRLRALERTTDGFKISDEDLRLRGQGEFFGTRQSGLPDLRIADIVEDQTIVEQANSAVATLVARDADLEDADHQPMRQYFEQFYVARLEGFAKAG